MMSRLSDCSRYHPSAEIVASVCFVAYTSNRPLVLKEFLLGSQSQAETHPAAAINSESSCNVTCEAIPPAIIRCQKMGWGAFGIQRRHRWLPSYAAMILSFLGSSSQEPSETTEQACVACQIRLSYHGYHNSLWATDSQACCQSCQHVKETWKSGSASSRCMCRFVKCRASLWNVLLGNTSAPPIRKLFKWRRTAHKLQEVRT